MVSMYDQTGVSGDPFPITDASLYFRQRRGTLDIGNLNLDSDFLYKIHIYYKAEGYMPEAGEFTAAQQVVGIVEFNWQGLSGTMFPDEILVISHDPGNTGSEPTVILRGLIPIEELEADTQKEADL